MFLPTLVQHYLSLSAQRSPEKVALICEHNRITYFQLDQSSTQLAQALQNSGIKRQDRVIVFMDNSRGALPKAAGVNGDLP